MYEDLIEKFIDVDEAAVATEVSPEKKMKQYYKKVLNSKLIKNTCTWANEQEWLKFWLFTDGRYIPVGDTHNDTLDAAEVLYCDLFRVGAIAGSIQDNALQADAYSKFTEQQISRLKQFFIQYKLSLLYVDAPQLGSFSAKVKSIEQLDYLLHYGKDDVDESIEEAIEVPKYLYHGTFKPLLDKIKSEGLRIEGTVKNYSDSEEGLVYLAKNFEEAEAFAEVSETVPDEWIDQVVVLKIDTDKLDKSKLADDPNVRDTEVMTFIYPQDIPFEAMEVVKAVSI